MPCLHYRKCILHHIARYDRAWDSAVSSLQGVHITPHSPLWSCTRQCRVFITGSVYYTTQSVMIVHETEPCLHYRECVLHHIVRNDRARDSAVSSLQGAHNYQTSCRGNCARPVDTFTAAPARCNGERWDSHTHTHTLSTNIIYSNWSIHRIAVISSVVFSTFNNTFWFLWLGLHGLLMLLFTLKLTISRVIRPLLTIFK